MEQTPLQSSSTPLGPPPKNWLVESILVTILCCLIPGIVAIVYATQVNTKWNNGDYEGARRASRDAGLWTKISFFIGLGLLVLGILLSIMGVGFGTYFMDRDNNGY
jgi:hypothetical protein